MKWFRERGWRYLTAMCVAIVPYSFSSAGYADDFTKLGGDLTSDALDHNSIQLPAPNVADPYRYALQLSGFAVFHGSLDSEKGLGPNFNNTSCGGCHINNGRGAVRLPGPPDDSEMVVKVSLPGLSKSGAPKDVPMIGEQLQDFSNNGKRRFKISLKWKEVPGKYADGTKYSLRKPDLDFQVSGYPQEKLAYSLRMTPPVIGPGLLEAIAGATILANADPNDSDHDGISGRPQYVPNLRTGVTSIGRFGFKASHPTVEQQSAAAAHNDLGVTSQLFLGDDAVPELSEFDLKRLAVYLQIAGVPKARNQADPKVQQGQTIFKTVGCAKCHTMTLQTGASENPEVSYQTIHPFTDLLLHDMGPGLADKRAEYSAKGSEWRTTPLWGLGFNKNLSDVPTRFLHDGRARTISEAIIWHGGEAQTIRNKFVKLKKADRQNLLLFLNSL